MQFTKELVRDHRNLYRFYSELRKRHRRRKSTDWRIRVVGPADFVDAYVAHNPASASHRVPLIALA